MNNNYNTKTIADITVYPEVYYCVYCGEKALCVEEYNHCECYIYRYCTCCSANKEHEISEMIKQTPVPNHTICKKINYNNDLYKLKIKYYGNS